MKRRFLKSLKILPWMVLLLGAVYLFVFDGGRDILYGRMHRLANETFAIPGYSPDDITRVEIYLLLGDKAKAHGETFSVSLFAPKSSVYGKVSLPTAAIKPFLMLWSQQETNLWLSGMCHEPAYGFRFYQSDELVQETAICWHCSNFQLDDSLIGGVTYGFQADSESGQKLLELCDQHLPYPKSE